jgi:hypothetical protein
MKKLYKASAEIEVFIMSEEEPLDFDIEDAIREEVSMNGCSGIFCKAVKKTDFIPGAWKDSIPYESDDDKTVEEIIKEMP